VVRSLASTRRVLAASPAYVGRHGTPVEPHDLDRHRLLLYTYHNPEELIFQRGEEVVRIPTRSTLEANDGQVLCRAALCGYGIVAQPMYMIYDDLVAGRLVPLLTNWELPALSINIVHPHRKYVPAKTRAFIDFIVEEFRKQDYQQRWSAMLSSRNEWP